MQASDSTHQPRRRHVFGFLRARAARWDWSEREADPAASAARAPRVRYVFPFLRPSPPVPVIPPVVESPPHVPQAPPAEVPPVEAPPAEVPVPEPERDAEPAPAVAPEPAVEAPVDWFARMREGLGKTRDQLRAGLQSLFSAAAIDEDLLEELESQLLMADAGVDATREIVDRVRELARGGGDDLREILRGELLALLAPCEAGLDADATDGPFVILVVGVNGAGKTTTIGKLAHRFRQEGRSVLLAAGDTFRAAAVEQLQVWGERNQVPVVAQQSGADSAAVIFDAVESARARGVDVVIADTAGRLHNKDNLMEELRKVVRVVDRCLPGAPHEVLLVLDAGTGQNALSQARTFQEAVQVSGIAMTKLDGTARGGILFAVARQLGIPVRFIGIGEGIEDLRPFEAQPFVDALLG